MSAVKTRPRSTSGIVPRDRSDVTLLIVPDSDQLRYLDQNDDSKGKCDKGK